MRFYHAMHYSAKRSLAIVCRLSVRLSLCDVGGSWPHRLKILETNCTNSWPNIFTLRSPKVIHLLPGEHGEILGRNVRSTPTSITSGWIVSTESHVILGGGVAVCLLLSAHRAVIFAISQLSFSPLHQSANLTVEHPEALRVEHDRHLFLHNLDMLIPNLLSANL